MSKEGQEGNFCGDDCLQLGEFIGRQSFGFKVFRCRDTSPNGSHSVARSIVAPVLHDEQSFEGHGEDPNV